MMVHKITRPENPDHNAHWDKEDEDFDACFPVMVHCETKAETEEVASLVHSHFKEKEEDNK